MAGRRVVGAFGALVWVEAAAVIALAPKPPAQLLPGKPCPWEQEGAPVQRSTPSPENFPDSLHKEPAKPPVPKRRAKSDAEDEGWQDVQRKWRRRHLRGSESFNESLHDFTRDGQKPEEKGDVLWKPVDDFRPPSQKDFWERLCNGTNTSMPSVANSSNASTHPAETWKIKENATCARGDLIGDEYDSEAEAVANCGISCAALVDDGCQRKKFRLCKLGAMHEESHSGSCLRLRVPGHAPPEAAARKPLEAKFWKAFCGRQANLFRVLFKSRLCVTGKVLSDEAPTEAYCADLTAADASCSKIFDFAEDTSQCRCVEKEASCNAGLAETSDGAEKRNVYIRFE